ncbi:G-protein coupled receptor Mth2-like isoform X1 [Lutzomyia longipalpis]|uniref:G-protein coupled receptor Mth2-like isoform X1 n=1 Tax=Lutzomyia longipalpis TaxID=7200 RepID=UPI0024835280|nr:G-protein coupled receptor Mth2-like isoform X1 [Lutzomyia longipalpis]XP_055684882.1 G-protein coupled receptor Mth2-like isoform X1 [Lutzomyia longipalpis]XP_055684883.1 G-protein coupled receptor Mth2-like isoform X1 [Lutzomyia longipalpis]XP_055684884.1 G-protein coupled receptor Mth2-like isoform X1 [Lutzomyia longipalpis]
MLLVKVILCLVISIHITVADSPCCPGENIFPDSCPNRTDTLLKCPHGKFMVDPLVTPDDEFEINEDGDLSLLEGDHIIEQGEFCVTNYRALANDSRRVALVCFTYNDASVSLYLIKGILTLISVCFIIVTLYVYWIIPGLRDTQDKVTCFCLICLASFFFLLGLVQIFTPENLIVNSVCVPLAFTLYFCIIAYFSWLNMVMVNVWKTTVVPRWRIHEKTWYTLCHIYAWSIPIILEVFMIVSHVTGSSWNPRIGHTSCWFAGAREMWIYVYIPISIMLAINVILFVWTCWILQMSNVHISPDRRRALQYKCMLYLKLFLLVGLTWIFEVFSYSYGDNSWFWIVVDIVNSLHGLLIFLILVVWRQRVRKELAGRKICCIRAPDSWQYGEDAEHERLNEEEGSQIITTATTTPNTVTDVTTVTK